MRELRKPDAALYIRERAIERFPGYGVSEAPPPDPISERETPLVLFYSQDKFRLTPWTWSEVIGYRVFWGTREDPTLGADVAAEVEAWLWELVTTDRGNPIAAVTDSNGPNLVIDDHETAVHYGTVEMVIAGVYRPARTGEAPERGEHRGR